MDLDFLKPVVLKDLSLLSIPHIQSGNPPPPPNYTQIPTSRNLKRNHFAFITTTPAVITAPPLLSPIYGDFVIYSLNISPFVLFET